MAYPTTRLFSHQLNETERSFQKYCPRCGDLKLHTLYYPRHWLEPYGICRMCCKHMKKVHHQFGDSLHDYLFSLYEQRSIAKANAFMAKHAADSPAPPAEPKAIPIPRFQKAPQDDIPDNPDPLTDTAPDTLRHCNHCGKSKYMRSFYRSDRTNALAACISCRMLAAKRADAAAWDSGDPEATGKAQTREERNRKRRIYDANRRRMLTLHGRILPLAERVNHTLAAERRRTREAAHARAVARRIANETKYFGCPLTPAELAVLTRWCRDWRSIHNRTPTYPQRRRYFQSLQPLDKPTPSPL